MEVKTNNSVLFGITHPVPSCFGNPQHMTAAVQQPVIFMTNVASHLSSTEVEKTTKYTSIKKKAEELNQKTLHNFGRKNHKPNKNGRKRCLPRERRKNRNGYLQEDLSDDGKTSYSIY